MSVAGASSMAESASSGGMRSTPLTSHSALRGDGRSAGQRSGRGQRLHVMTVELGAAREIVDIRKCTAACARRRPSCRKLPTIP